ncbi:hypothetical protein TNIN_243681 [Trichonephila inaurata madagascariensis]|uniref:Uncharacterized protein n=1 Tax=Trichonephila inaurata madagascariensis TaxID=2747483 RepID=A0A8X6IMI7_9ARAC|nr:hypothetical protein TNIN_243681 [Trichonephila inaurata madagascariensis]
MFTWRLHQAFSVARKNFYLGESTVVYDFLLLDSLPGLSMAHFWAQSKVNVEFMRIFYTPESVFVKSDSPVKVIKEIHGAKLKMPLNFAFLKIAEEDIKAEYKADCSPLLFGTAGLPHSQWSGCVAERFGGFKFGS